jgi:hypothetical protein
MGKRLVRQTGMVGASLDQLVLAEVAVEFKTASGEA